MTIDDILQQASMIWAGPQFDAAVAACLLRGKDPNAYDAVIGWSLTNAQAVIAEAMLMKFIAENSACATPISD